MSREVKQHSYTISAVCLTPSHVASLNHISIFLSTPLPCPQFLPLSPPSPSLLQHWDLFTKTMNPSTASGNPRGWDNPSPPHMLWQLMLLTSKGLRIFFLLSKVMANDWPREILYLKLWNFSRALDLTLSTVVLCSCSLLYPWRMLFQQEMQSAVDFPEVLVSASLPSHFLLQGCKLGRAFPQDCYRLETQHQGNDDAHGLRDRIPSRKVIHLSGWWAVRWCMIL